MGPSLAGRWLGVPGLAVAAVLLAAPLVCGQEDGDHLAVTGLVKPGDVVTVTRWSGGKVRGTVTDTGPCALVIRARNRVQAFPAFDIKTLRLHVPRPKNAGTTFTEEMARQCDDISCVPAALAVLGIGAAFQGVDDLSHPPKVIYRAKTRQPPAAACTGAASANWNGPTSGH